MPYSLSDPPPKSARYRLRISNSEHCLYFRSRERLLAAARRLVAEGKTPLPVEKLSTRPPGRPKGSGTTPRQLRERVYHLLRVKLAAPEEFNVNWHHPWLATTGKRGNHVFVTYHKVWRWLKARDLLAVLESVETFDALLPALFPEYAKVAAWRAGEERMQAFYAELEKNPSATLETP